MNFYWTFGIIIALALVFAIVAGNRRPRG
jgi:hypothetical protein